MDKVNNICIIGYGSIGKRHHCILQKMFPVANFDIIDVDTKLTIEDCLKKQYDLTLICTPSSNHINIAKQFINNSNFIFIEKPLDSDVNLIRSNLNVFDGKKIHVGCNLRYTEAYKKILSFADRAKLINVVSMSYMPKWYDQRHWLDSYCANKKMGGGVLLDFIHEPDYIVSVLGLPDDVNVFNERLFDNITIDSDDSCIMNWRYKKAGVLVNFMLSYACNPYERYCSMLLENSKLVRIDIGKHDIEQSYKKQWEDILLNGLKNTYQDCLNLYEKLKI